MADKKYLNEVATLVSQSGTVHVIGGPPCKEAPRRTSTICGMHFLPEDGPHVPIKECQYCVAATRFGASIRALQMGNDGKPGYSIYAAAEECHCKEIDIINAVAGLPDLYWLSGSDRFNIIRGMVGKVA